MCVLTYTQLLFNQPSFPKLICPQLRIEVRPTTLGFVLALWVAVRVRVDLDLWPWPSIPEELWLWLIHMQKVKVISHSFER